MRRNIKALLLIGIIMSTLSFTFVNSKYFEISKNLDLFATLYKELNTFYVDELDSEELIQDGIKAMLESLDPYTVYYPEEDMEGFNMQMTGKYGGIGALIRTHGEYVVIAEPYEGFPAQKAGLIAGDRIIEIDGKPFTGKKTNDVSKTLRGAPGSEVTIIIEKPRTGERITKKMIREEVVIESVPYYGMINDEVGYITLTSFTNDCSGDVKNAFQELKQKNPQLNGIVLDLRGNPGGLLQEAVNVANIFIPKGEEVVTTKGRIDDWQKAFKTRSAPVDTKIPLVVLTSRGSASASEIVAGVIQDYDRGIVVGEQTFGKGLVQSTKDIGYNSKLKLTTAKYYLPSGRCIQAIDYSGKYRDGAEKIPDSLRTAYKTENGRTVYDAGGVDPDVEVELKELGKIVGSLYSKQLIFDFANDFMNRNPSINSPKEFKISDAEYEKFVAFVSDKEYDYTTKSEQLLEELKKQAEEEMYLSSIEKEIADLESKIKHDKEQDLYKYKNQIQDYIKDEIVTRYHFQKGRIEASLVGDPFIDNAIEVLKNEAEYQQILTKK